ncbi:hypothetical protein ACFQ60_19895 [Streptomyces zhihengii]
MPDVRGAPSASSRTATAPAGPRSSCSRSSPGPRWWTVSRRSAAARRLSSPRASACRRYSSEPPPPRVRRCAG